MNTTSAGASRGVWCTVRALPRPVVMALVGIAVNRLGTFFPIFLVLFVTSEGVEPAAAGLLLTAYGGGAIGGVVLGGWLVDRYGVRVAIVSCTALAGAAVAAVPLVSSYAALAVLCVAVGLFTEAYRPASTSLLASCVPAEDLVVVSAVYRLALNTGATLAPLLGAVVASSSLPLVFAVDAATSLLFAVVASTQLPTTPHGRRQRPVAGGYVVVLRDRRFRLVLAGMLLIALVESQYLATMPLEVTARGLGPSVYAGLVSLNALLVILIELPVTRTTRNWSVRTPMALGTLLIGAGIALVGVPGGLPLLVVATVVWTLGEVIAAPSATAYPALVAPAVLRGRYLAAMNASQSLGYTLGPALGILLLVHVRSGLWVACALTGALAAGVTWAGTRDAGAAQRNAQEDPVAAA